MTGARRLHQCGIAVPIAAIDLGSTRQQRQYDSKLAAPSRFDEGWGFRRARVRRSSGRPRSRTFRFG